MSDDHTTDTGDRLGGRHWTYGPGAPAEADRPGRRPARDDSDGWYSSGADEADQRHLDDLAHTDDDPRDEAEAGGGWLMVDPAALDGVRPLTAAELDAVRDQLRAKSAPSYERAVGGESDAVEQDTAAAVARAHRAVRDAATVGPQGSFRPADEARRAELARYDPEPCCRAVDEEPWQSEEADAAARGDAR